MKPNKQTQPDAETREILAVLAGETGLYSADVAERRAVYDRVFSEMTALPAEDPASEQAVVMEVDGNEPVRAILISPPAGEASGTILFVHGGGWSMGSAECYVPLGRCIAAETGQQVLVLDYPLVPESTHPVALNAVVKAANWMLENYESPLVLAGDSAGGHLVFLAAARPELRQRLSAICLIYPVLDLRPGAEYESRQQWGGGDHFLTREGIELASAAYCGDASPDTADITPMLFTDLASLPPACFVLPTLDPLYDEGKLMFERMQSAGAATELIEIPGSIHGCLSWSARISSARTALSQTCQWMQNRML